MLDTTPGRLMLDEALPPPYRGRDLSLDAKGIKSLFQEIAERHPKMYGETVKRLTQLGGDVAYGAGSLSFDLDDLATSRAVDAERKKLDLKVRGILDDPQYAHDVKLRDKAIVDTVMAAQKPMEQLAYDEAVDANNPLATQARIGARGNPTNFKSLVAGDLMYSDHRLNPVPVPITRSYAEGLTPAQYWAGTYGARQGIYSVKKGTADSGYLAKTLAAGAHDLVVTAVDHDDDKDRSHVGLVVDVDDQDSVGSLLARPAAGYPRNTRITPQVLDDVRKRGMTHIMVRSPIVGGPPGGGVFARDVGHRERGGLSPLGDFVGIAAAQSVSERITQGALNAKHTGGIAGENRVASGFGYINNLLNPPKLFPGVATHAQQGGVVSDVRPAPQGGQFVAIDDKVHHVPTGHDATVKPGDRVSAGDVISDGPPNPAEVVRFKGIGEGRRYLVKALGDALKDMRQTVSRRNLELVAAGAVNHVRITDEYSGHVPDDVVRYSDVADGYEPRPGATATAPRNAVGRYLEAPVLHHTIGTLVTSDIAKQCEQFGIKQLETHGEPPPFTPVFVRGVDAMSHHPDWMTKHLGSGLAKSTLRSVHRGAVSDAEGTSYVPALAERSRFGQHGKSRGWSADAEPRDGDGDGRVHDGTPHERPKSRTPWT